jgi:hypothetical protein
LAFVWMLVLLGLAYGLVAANTVHIVPTDTPAATAAIARHAGIDATTTGADLAAKQQLAQGFQPITGATDCEALKPNYPCLKSAVFAMNAVLPPAAATNTPWEIASDAPSWIVWALTGLKLLSWALAAVLLAGVTGLLRKD